MSTSVLLGAAISIFLVAAVLSALVSSFLLGRYRTAVLASMRARAGWMPTEADNASLTPLSERITARPQLKLQVWDESSRLKPIREVAALYGRARCGLWTLEVMYIVAGVAHAASTAVLWFLCTGNELVPLRVLISVGVYMWPVLLTLNLVNASDRHLQLISVVVYFCVLLLLATAVAVVAKEGLFWSNLALSWRLTLHLWTVEALPPTIFFLMFMHRRIRAVGPLVFTFMLVSVFGAHFTLLLLDTENGTRFFATLPMSVNHIFALMVIGFMLFGILGWFAVRWIRNRYEGKQLSDQSITIDSLWLLFTLFNCVVLVSGTGGWGFSVLLAFAAYKLVLYREFSFLQPRIRAQRNTKLLLLRVFGAQRRSERLLETLGAHWRYVGSIQLIAGTDLATATLQPHEFLDFVSGRLSRRFIQGRAELDQRLAEMDTCPDGDGRYRVNEFFCHDDTWRLALSQLVAECDVVLMDLRGFSRQHNGCVDELTELVNVVPLLRVVLIIDGTTDLPFLEETLSQKWETMSSTSPNLLGAAAELNIFRLAKDDARAIKRLLLTVLSAGSAGRTENGERVVQPANKVASRESLTGNPASPASLLFLAQRYYAQGKYKEAILYFERLLGEEPDNLEYQLYWLLANVKGYGIHGSEKGITNVLRWQNLTQEEKSLAQELFVLAGRENLKKGNLVGAEQYLLGAYTISPSQDVAKLLAVIEERRGDAAHKTEDYEQALACYRRAAAYDPKSRTYPHKIARGMALRAEGMNKN